MSTSNAVSKHFRGTYISIWLQRLIILPIYIYLLHTSHVRNVHSVAVASAETEMVALRPVTIAFVTGTIGCFQATCRYQKRNNCEGMTLTDGNVIRLHMYVPFIKTTSCRTQTNMISLALKNMQNNTEHISQKECVIKGGMRHLYLSKGYNGYNNSRRTESRPPSSLLVFKNKTTTVTVTEQHTWIWDLALKR